MRQDARSLLASQVTNDSARIIAGRRTDRMSHTPGPWTNDKNDSGIHQIWATRPSYEMSIADICGVADSEANARLIAAAPELLLELQTMIAAANLVLNRWERGDLASAVAGLDEATDDARDAIARATGKDTDR